MEQQHLHQLQHMLEALRQDFATQLQLIEDELAELPRFGTLATVQHRNVLNRAYMLSFARLALDLKDLDEVLGWLKDLHARYPRPAAQGLH